MKHPDTQWLRAIAIILVINSHLDHYYPVMHIGTGGAIGNSIFFFLSAFGLYISQQERRKDFAEWCKRRTGRIYPSLWVVLILLYIPISIWQGKLSCDNIMTFAGYFFYSPFWFLQAIFIYYLLAFPFIKNLLKTPSLATLGLLCLLYTGFYISAVDLSTWSVENLPFRLIHYFMVFLFGIYIATKNRDINYSGIRDYIILFSIVGLFYTHKYLMLKGLYFDYQFLQQASMYPILYYLLKISRSPFITARLMQSPVLSRMVDILADHTLEIYMVHFTILNLVLDLQMPFPINVIVLLLLTACLSVIVNKLANFLKNSILSTYRYVCGPVYDRK